MRLVKLVLENFRRFERLDVPLGGCAVSIFVGDNGSGKSSALEAIAKGLGWLVARISRERGMGSPVQDAEILNGKSEGVVSLHVEHQGRVYEWTLVGTRRGCKKTRGGQLTEVTSLADIFRTAMTEDPERASFPLMACYPVERVVLDIPLKIKVRHNFGQMDGYDNALHGGGVDFRRFFEWFRDREDSENETSVLVMEQLSEYITLSDWLADPDPESLWSEIERLRLSTKDRQLMAIRSAVSSFMPGFSNLRIQRRPRLRMMIDKDGQSLDVGQLSQGEKSLMALVGDIARRLSMMNPTLRNPLEGEGIVLIDEIDLHLHPRWQRTILGNLARTFPNCQFIMTTHSPIVISQERDICCFMLSDQGIRPLGKTYGLDVNQVLLQEMDADIRNPDVQQAIDALLDAIQDGELDRAQRLLADLASELPADHLELAKARLLLSRRVRLR